MNAKQQIKKIRILSIKDKLKEVTADNAHMFYIFVLYHFQKIISKLENIKIISKYKIYYNCNPISFRIIPLLSILLKKYYLPHTKLNLFVDYLLYFILKILI